VAAWELLNADTFTLSREAAPQEWFEPDEIEFFARSYPRRRIQKCSHTGSLLCFLNV
jgi:hypothetical protein